MSATQRFGFRAALALLILALCLAGYVSTGRAAGTQVTAAFIDVGQGDSALLSDGNGFDVLIDGGKPGAGPAVVEYLRQHGVTQLEVMVVSHADSDHVGGLEDVLAANDITVGAVVYNGYQGDTATWYGFATAVAGEGLIMTPAQFPATFQWGDMQVQVLNPETGLVNPETNNASVVLRISHGDVSWLFTGDIDSTQEAAIVARGTPVAVDILKVAHHGSLYSSGTGFLSAVGAQEAVISVGQNSYGHPAPEALQRLADSGAQTWRTDLSGSLVFVSNGITYTVPLETFGVYLPVVMRGLVVTTPPPTSTTPPPSETTPPPTATTPAPASLTITELSGTTAPEYVVIQNSGGVSQDMTGWSIVSVVGPQTYTFPAGFVLGAGTTIRIESYNGASSNPPAVLLWSTSAIWNNAGDKAVLYNPAAQAVSSMCYGSGCP